LDNGNSISGKRIEMKKTKTNCLSRRFQKIEFIGNLNVAIHFQWGVGNTKKVHQSYAQLTKRVFKSNHYDLYKTSLYRINGNYPCSLLQHLVASSSKGLNFISRTISIVRLTFGSAALLSKEQKAEEASGGGSTPQTQTSREKMKKKKT